MSDQPPIGTRPRYLFVTGRLAEFSLRAILSDLAERFGFDAEVAVLPITVAALMPTKWIARHLEVPPQIDRIILPGLCRGDLAPIQALRPSAEISLGPQDLRDLPQFFGGKRSAYDPDGPYSIEILAEINHAPQLTRKELLEQARHYRSQGADRIDLGCDPGGPWSGVGDAVRALVDEGFRVSIDSFDPIEVRESVRAGADLVLSVNASNRESALDWGVEVVAIPDQIGTLEGLEQTYEALRDRGIHCRLDPILEPIGFGLTSSLIRYNEVRQRWPEAEMMMGIGNLTELTDVDSSGVNMVLIGICEELGIRSILTTAVIPWARTSVREIDIARRMAHHSITTRTLPKRLDPRLVTLRDPDVPLHGLDALRALHERLRDPNWRIFAEDGQLYAINGSRFLSDSDPYALFDLMEVDDPEHAFYLGYELMKAKTALTLGKGYRQDQALDWGYLTEPEISALERRKAIRGPQATRRPHRHPLRDEGVNLGATR